MIGLAGGMTAAVLKQYGMEVEAVDVDPAALDVARRWFAFDGAAVAADGRRYVETCARRYDVCVLDAYLGEGLPAHLATREAFAAVRRALAPGGALVVNFIGAPGGDAFAAMYRTLNAVFPRLLAFRSEPGDDVQAITLFASERPIEFAPLWRASAEDAGGVDPVRDELARLAIPPPGRDATVLSDDYNPLDHLRAREALAWRGKQVVGGRW